jgi:hypothetical protein
MTVENLHVADDQLLLHASGELSAKLNSRISTHLDRCSQCRARLEELESTLAEFTDTHLRVHNLNLPPSDVSRDRLKSRLAELSAQSGEHKTREYLVRENGFSQSGWVARARHHQGAIFAAFALAACLLLAISLRAPEAGKRSYSVSASLGRGEEPDLRLTPGATIPVTQNQVCSAEAATEAATTIAAVPVSLKRKVFEEYGVTPPQPDAYEVDYLITPELGGATDIRNLWPEPYQDTVWNAHVKDQLEDRLHEMVCHGDVDLATAQHDISTDWIAAYRKYFRTDKPLADKSSVSSTGLRRSLPLT